MVSQVGSVLIFCRMGKCFMAHQLAERTISASTMGAWKLGEERAEGDCAKQ